MGHSTITAYINLANQLLPERLQVSKLTAHGLRGSLATNAIKAGAPIVAVNKTMQHKSLQSTLEYVRPHDELYLASGMALAQSFNKKQATHIAGVRIDNVVQQNMDAQLTTYSATSTATSSYANPDEHVQRAFCPKTGNEIITKSYENLWCQKSGRKLEDWELEAANDPKKPKTSSGGNSYHITFNELVQFKLEEEDEKIKNS